MSEKYIALSELQKFPIRKDHYDKEHGSENFVFGVETVLEYAECLPEAEVEEVHYARWHTLADYKYRRTVECIHCNSAFEFSKKMGTQIDLLPRCPVCGARMDGKKVLAERYHAGDRVYVIVDDDVNRRREVVPATIEEVHCDYPYSILVKLHETPFGSHSVLLSRNSCDTRLFAEECLAIRKLLEMGEKIDG